MRLQMGEDEMRDPRLTAPPTCKAGSSAHWVARSRALLRAGQISRRDTAMPTRQIRPSRLREGALRPPETPSYLAFQEELLVPALQDIQLRVVEFGILVTKPISLSHVSAPTKKADQSEVRPCDAENMTQRSKRGGAVRTLLTQLPRLPVICGNSQC